jgi:DNA polymerase-3 subunit delta'
MLVHDNKKSHILIATEIDKEFQRLKEALKPNRVVGFISEKFLLEDAKAVIAEAYISESQTKYIVMGAYEFHPVSQNSLLKVLEEPPPHIEFIIISPTKSILLPTVRSRLPIVQGETIRETIHLDLNLARVDYAQIFAFLKEHARVKKSEAKMILQALYFRATVVDMLILSSSQLDNFDKAYRLLELNARPQSVLAMIIMSFVRER